MDEHQKSAHAIENGMLDSLNALSMVRDNETGSYIPRSMGRMEKALQAYDLKLVVNPNSAALCNNVGAILCSMEQF